MPEIPKQRIPERTNPKPRQTRKRTEGPDHGIYGSADSTDYLTHSIVPALADTLGAAQPTLRGMQGLFGTLSRDVTLHHKNGDRSYYAVSIDRTSDTDRRGKKLAQIALEVIICDMHKLDDHELLTEWPLLEAVGAADSLIVDSVMLHTPGVDADEYDLDDPEFILKLMGAQSEFITEPEPGEGMLDDIDYDEDDEEGDEDDDDGNESLGAMLYGSEVERYFQKTLRVVRGKRPTLTLKAGYDTDSDSFPISLGDAYRNTLIGDTPAEVAVLTQLNDESFRAIDSDLVREFEEALAIVGIIKRRKGKKS